MLVQPMGVLFAFCRFLNTKFSRTCPLLLASKDVESLSLFCSIMELILVADVAGETRLLWYNSGVGGVVLMYQPHCGLISAPLVPPEMCCLSVDWNWPYGLVGSSTPLLPFILGMYLDDDDDKSARVHLLTDDLIGLLFVAYELGPWLCDEFCVPRWDAMNERVRIFFSFQSWRVSATKKR